LQALSELAIYKSSGGGDASSEKGSGDVVAGYNDMFQENYMLQEEVKILKIKIKDFQVIFLLNILEVKLL
jgi:hypothetical protein